MNAKVWIAASAVVVCVVAWFAMRGDGSNATVAAPPAEARAEAPSDGTPEAPSSSREPLIELADDTDPSDEGDPAVDATALLTLRVIDPDGAPAVGAEVVLSTPAERSVAVSSDHAIRVVADAAGTASIPADAFVGDWTLVARDGDRASSGECTPAAFPGGVRDGAELRMFELVTVRGRVVDDADEPIPEAVVSIASNGVRLFSGTPPARERIAVDDQGRFASVVEATGGNFLFTAARPGGATCAATATIGRGDNDEVVLRFPSAGAISGVVLDHDNRPVAGAVVHLLRYDDAGAPIDRRKRRRAEADEDGRFRFEEDPGGAWYLVATAEGRCSSDPLASSAVAGAGHAVTLRLVPCTTISGEVVDADGAPLAGVMVGAVTDLEGTPELYVLHGGDNELVYPLVMASSDADGRFVLEGVRDGVVPYRVLFMPDRANRDRVVTEHGVLPGTDDLRVVLSEDRVTGGVLELRVTVEGTGEALESGTLFLYERSPQGAWIAQGMRSFDGGVARREGLQPGREYCASVQPITDHLSALVPTWTAELGVHAVDAVMPLARLVEVPVPADVATGGALEVVAADPHPDEVAPWTAPIEGGAARLHLRPGAYTARVAGADAFDFEVTSAFVAVPTGDR